MPALGPDFLARRRKTLGIPLRVLAERSGVPAATVRRVLTDPARAKFAAVAAVGRVVGWDVWTGRVVPARQVFEDAVRAKAEYLVRLVQGSQALEAAAVDEEGRRRLVERASDLLRAGDKSKVWE